MKKFNFNLQSVLDHRLLLEEREQEKLFKIQHEIGLAEAGREQLRNQIHGLRLELAQPESGEINIENVLQTVRYIGKLDDDLAVLSRKIAHLDQQKRSQSEVLLKARRNREVLENVKEKELAQYEREAGVMEQKLLDELAVVKFSSREKQNLPASKH